MAKAMFPLLFPTEAIFKFEIAVEPKGAKIPPFSTARDDDE
jgi:hypothetical protein